MSKLSTSPAFPFTFNEDGVEIVSTGMHMRHYFAAHAPEVPDWYSPKSDERGSPSDSFREYRYFSWRWYYADMMLAEEPAEGGK